MAVLLLESGSGYPLRSRLHQRYICRSHQNCPCYHEKQSEGFQNKNRRPVPGNRKPWSHGYFLPSRQPRSLYSDSFHGFLYMSLTVTRFMLKSPLNNLLEHRKKPIICPNYTLFSKQCKKLVNPTKTVGKCTKKCTRKFIFCSLFLSFVIYYICK